MSSASWSSCPRIWFEDAPLSADRGRGDREDEKRLAVDEVVVDDRLVRGERGLQRLELKLGWDGVAGPRLRGHEPGPHGAAARHDVWVVLAAC